METSNVNDRSLSKSYKTSLAFLQASEMQAVYRS